DTLEPWVEGIAGPFQQKLADIVSAPGQAAATDSAADPLLAPPLYGRWHALRAIVARTASAWLDQLNPHPPLRAPAAFRTSVVQEHQEALMASAWEQAADLARANQRLRQLQISLAVSQRLQARHFSPLIDEAAVRVGAPMLGRLRAAAGPAPTIHTMVEQIGPPH